MIGIKYGKLTPTALMSGNICRNRVWHCICDCGKETDAKETSLISGKKQSCGCLYSESSARKTHGETKTRLHKIWSGMIDRCNNPHCHDYNNYGGRGITIYKEWENYIFFRNWALSHDYSCDLTIERINVNGNYEPSNCRWATTKEQQNNRRNNHIIEYCGEAHNITEWSVILGINIGALKQRIHMGWSTEKAFTKPIQKHTVNCKREETAQ